jgi:AraC-like DNA-binding protein
LVYHFSIEDRVHPIQKVALLTELLGEQGTSAEKTLAGSHISPSNLTDENSRISMRQILTVFKNVVEQSKNPGIGFSAGQRIHISSYGIFGYAMLSSATLLECVELSIKYHQLTAPMFQLTFCVEENQGICDFNNIWNIDELLEFSSEFQLSLILSLLKDVAGPTFSFSEVRIAYPQPAHGTLYDQVFGCPIIFESETTEIRFSADFLRKPTLFANPITAKMCEQQCENLLTEMEVQGGVARDVYNVLVQTPGQFPDIDSIAKQLHITSRTLRRKLVAEGTSYREILADVRKMLAIDYLKKTQLNTEEISERLGFSDAANFRQAFKKWTGKTPSRYRDS